MLIRLKHLQAALDVLAEDDNYYSLVQPLSDQLDQDVINNEVKQNEIIVNYKIKD